MLGIDIQQILLHLLNFVILFTGLYVLLYGPVKKFMDSRIEEYKKQDDEAEDKAQSADRDGGFDGLLDKGEGEEGRRIVLDSGYGHRSRIDVLLVEGGQKGFKICNDLFQHIMDGIRLSLEGGRLALRDAFHRF